MKSEVIPVGNTATPVLTADGAATYPMSAIILNNTGVEVRFGGPDVTMVNGFPIQSGSVPLSIDVINEDLYAITAAGGVSINVLRRGS